MSKERVLFLLFFYPFFPGMSNSSVDVVEVVEESSNYTVQLHLCFRLAKK